MKDMHSIKKLIFLVQWPVTSYEEKAWQFDFLRSQGFEVEVYDLTALLNLESFSKLTILNKLEGDFIYKIVTYKELGNLLEKAVHNSIFIDYLANHSNVSFKFEKVYRLLKKHSARYVVISSGALPIMAFDKNVYGKLKKVLTKIQKALNPFLLSDFITCKIILFFTKRSILYPVPCKIFGGASSEVMQLFITNRNLDRRAIIPINSFDYDSYVYSNRNLVDGEELNTEKICVFLDEAITNHPDFDLLGIEYISANDYFLSMNRFFDFIESEIGVKVVIAAHPRSSYELTPNVFGGRAIMKGKSAELIIRSELVIMHMSTSVSFAIIGKKPVVVVKTEGIRNNSYLNKLVDNMAKNLGTKSINIDRSELSISLLDLRINYENYDAYLYKYIKSRNAEELPVWEIVVSEIRKIKNILSNSDCKGIVDGK